MPSDRLLIAKLVQWLKLDMVGSQLTCERGLHDRAMGLILLVVSPGRPGAYLQLADRAEQLGETLVRQGLSTESKSSIKTQTADRHHVDEGCPTACAKPSEEAMICICTRAAQQKGKRR